MGVWIPQEKSNFGGGQTWACPVGLHWGMDLWGNNVAFYGITLIWFIYLLIMPSAKNGPPAGAWS